MNIRSSNAQQRFTPGAELTLTMRKSCKNWNLRTKEEKKWCYKYISIHVLQQKEI
jgi:hypothetical protein